MDKLEFERDLMRLRCGELRLAQPEDNGMSRFASAWFGDLKRYISALEAGYREVCQLLDAYRANDRRRETLRACKGLQEARLLAGEKWSRRAALGYAAMAANQLQGSPARVVQLLELMEDIMDAYPRRTAEGYYDAMVEDETPPHPSPAATPSPQGEGGQPVTAPTEDGT